jgi:type I restriction enzyme S subunit
MKNDWQIKRIGDVCDIYQPKTISAKEMTPEGKYVVFGANGIIGRYDKYNHEEPQLLITCRGATCGSVNISESKSWITGNAMVIRPKDNLLDLKYLEYIFRGGIDVKKIITGTAQPQITRTNLEPIEILVPPPLEQKRIVKILDAVFEKTTRSKDNAEKNLQNSKELFESYLQSIFENPGKDWEEKKLGDICDFVRGPFGGSLKKSIFKKEGYVVYEQQHAIYNQFTEVRYFIDEKKFNEMKRFKLKPGDLIMSCSGTMGKIAIAPDDINQGIINQALLKLSPHDNLHKEFLKYWMESRTFQDDLKIYTKGAAIKNVVSVKILKEIKMLVPKIQEQRTIVKRINALFLETRRLEAIYQKKLLNIEELKKSILKRAFNGDL